MRLYALHIYLLLVGCLGSRDLHLEAMDHVDVYNADSKFSENPEYLFVFIPS